MITATQAKELSQANSVLAEKMNLVYYFIKLEAKLGYTTCKVTVERGELKKQVTEILLDNGYSVDGIDPDFIVIKW